MTKMVRVRTIGSRQVREMTLEEARNLLEKTYDDPLGGLVTDARTGEAIWRIGPETEEILIVEQMIGGG
jgi:hypothetical protein